MCVCVCVCYQMLGLWPMLLFAFFAHEIDRLQQDLANGEVHVTIPAILILLLGCIAGTGIGYSSWWCRDQVSATSFTLIGVLNKCLTILINVFIWDKHAPPLGIASLGLCLAGGVLYQQAPMRKDESPGVTFLPSTFDKDVSNREKDDDDMDGAWKTDMTEFEHDDDESETEIELLEAPDGISKRKK
jgi:uncharacterized integral membrane protein